MRKGDGKSLCAVRATQGPEIPVLSDALLVGRMVPRPDRRWAASPWLSREAHRGRRDATSGRQAASWGRGVSLLRPQAARTLPPFLCSSPPRSFILTSFRSLPSFSQIYQHLALVRRQTQSQPLYLGREQARFLPKRVWGVGKRRRLSGGRLTQKVVFSSDCLTLDLPPPQPQLPSL